MIGVSHSCLIETPLICEAPAKAVSISRLRESKPTPITWFTTVPTASEWKAR
jgi:hypothetical protein